MCVACMLLWLLSLLLMMLKYNWRPKTEERYIGGERGYEGGGGGEQAGENKRQLRGKGRNITGANTL